MNISIRKFIQDDIPNKIRWINDPNNNQYLHYDLPLEVDKTRIWFNHIKEKDDRYDGIIEVDGTPVGLIGLLSIDRKNQKAEYYICIGEYEYHKHGVASEASRILLDMAFNVWGLNRIYLFTEEENLQAQVLFTRIGFHVEGLLKEDIFKHGVPINRYLMSITRSNYKGQRSGGEER